MNLLKNSENYFNNKIISVVGNAEIKNDYSVDIDSSDIVIRFNHGALNYLNYPKLGTKMDIFATNGWTDKNYKKIINYINHLDCNIKILLTRPISRGLNHGLFLTEPFIKVLNNKPNKIVEIKKNIFLENKIKNYYNFTSGIITIMFLKQFNCKEIKIFGFDNFSSGHFYEVGKDVTRGHDKSVEKIVLDSFKNIDNIKIYK
jgi:hypothetical protein